MVPRPPLPAMAANRVRPCGTRRLGGGRSTTTWWAVAVILCATLLLAGRWTTTGQWRGTGAYAAFVCPAVDFTAATTEASVSTSDLSALGTCICDLTVGICDVRCCCDSDCGSVSVPSSLCLEDGPPDATLDCSSAVTATNRNNAALFVEGILCVERDNSTSKDDATGCYRSHRPRRSRFT